VLAQNGGLERLLSGFLPGRDLEFNIADVLDHEKRAGIVCALTALCVACRSYVGVGDPVDGNIILPPAASWGKTRDGQGRWMDRALRESLFKVRGRSGVHPNHAFASITRAE